MSAPDLFSIGEVAKLFHLSVSSLRHYEDIGLVKPEKTDPATNYRYYSVKQFEALNTIRYLRALDMPLSEIGDFLGNRDVERMEEKLRQQRDAVAEKQRELSRIQRKIENRLAQLHDAQTAALDRIELIEAAPCRIVWMEDSLNIRGFLDMEAPIRDLDRSAAEAVVFLGKVGVGISAENLNAGRFSQYGGVFLLLDEEDRYSGETCTLPEALCMRVRFRGSHTDSPAQYARLMDFAREQRLAPAGFSREITMIDYGITNDTEKFVTEISVPVKNETGGI